MTFLLMRRFWIYSNEMLNRFNLFHCLHFVRMTLFGELAFFLSCPYWDYLDSWAWMRASKQFSFIWFFFSCQNMITTSFQSLVGNTFLVLDSFFKESPNSLYIPFAAQSLCNQIFRVILQVHLASILSCHNNIIVYNCGSPLILVY